MSWCINISSEPAACWTMSWKQEKLILVMRNFLFQMLSKDIISPLLPGNYKDNPVSGLKSAGAWAEPCKICFKSWLLTFFGEQVNPSSCQIWKRINIIQIQYLASCVGIYFQGLSGLLKYFLHKTNQSNLLHANVRRLQIKQDICSKWIYLLKN